ncbi:MAG: Zn-ribbon domain-containing OB-fold protein [Proteobacteria bacterium]|nr:Zn-ribbon domain-containing OB-fold protein [Pseudomonadota bacterium]
MTGKPAPRPNADTKPFWDACNEGRLTYQHCTSCGHAQFYPRSLCVQCGAPALEWRDADPTGTVYTFTVVHRAPSPAFREGGPYVLALVDLSDGFRMMMNVINCPPDSVTIGMPVRITFEEREGQRVPQAEPRS